MSPSHNDPYLLMQVDLSRLATVPRKYLPYQATALMGSLLRMS
jgi:hypothetical protein